MRALMSGLAVAGLAGLATAQDIELSWWTIDGGGGAATGGAFAIEGTIGQPDASPTMSGGTFQLTGGFWAGVTTPPACLPDLAPPEGVLDLADVLAFVAAFQAGDPLVDFDGNGLFDLIDAVTFATAFTAGCP